MPLLLAKLVKLKQTAKSGDAEISVDWAMLKDACAAVNIWKRDCSAELLDAEVSTLNSAGRPAKFGAEVPPARADTAPVPISAAMHNRNTRDDRNLITGVSLFIVSDIVQKRRNFTLQQAPEGNPRLDPGISSWTG